MKRRWLNSLNQWRRYEKEATATMTTGKQLKTKLSTLSKTQEADQRLLENINEMISDASM
jgi:hypothetical protein